MVPRLAAGLAGLVLAGLTLLAGCRASEPAPKASGTAEAAEPSAANVDPGVHAEMMRLKAEADATPDDLDAQLAFAQMALGAHRGPDAAEALERAVALAPEARQPWLDLAQAYAIAEDWDASAEASERMLARFPDDPSARYNIGAAHANAGRLAQARTAWTAVAVQTDDAPLAAQATASLAQLDAMATAPEASPPAGRAPPLAEGETALPAGHPPIGSASGARGAGVETRVVDGGRADPGAVRALVTDLADSE